MGIKEIHFAFQIINQTIQNYWNILFFSFSLHIIDHQPGAAVFFSDAPQWCPQEVPFFDDQHTERCERVFSTPHIKDLTGEFYADTYGPWTGKHLHLDAFFSVELASLYKHMEINNQACMFDVHSNAPCLVHVYLCESQKLN